VNQSTTILIAINHQSFAISRRSYGPYAQATYNLGGLSGVLDGLNLTVGARYTIDDTNGSATDVTTSPLGSSPPTVTSVRVKNEAPTYTIGVDYQIPTTLLYAKVSRGYKSGGFAPTAVNPAHTTFKPEFVTTYETGHKSDFRIGDMSARVNSAIYYTNYSDIQRTAADLYQAPNSSVVQFGGATYNAGKAEIMGFETDAAVQLFTRLTLMANYSYMYGKYNQFELISASVVPQIDCTGQAVPNGQVAHYECNPFQSTPRHQGSVSMRYQLPVAEQFGTMDGTVTYSYTDRQYSSTVTVPEAEPGAWLDSYGLLNAGFNWNSVYGTNFDVQIYGTNLTDRTYRVTNSNVWNTLMYQSTIYGEPRIFGVQLSYHLGG
jgi:iron complex outermembrane receptor protein